jgi:uncharacterized protein
MSSESLHEAPDALSPHTRDVHRAIVSLIEELEAIDWYQQRAEGCSDPALRDVLEHNKDEEIEHAVMTLEWLRREVPALDRELREILFRDGPIVREEKPPPAAKSGSLAVGSLRGAP